MTDRISRLTFPAGVALATAAFIWTAACDDSTPPDPSGQTPPSEIAQVAGDVTLNDSLPLGGTVVELQRDSEVLSETSAEDGSFGFEDVPPGGWDVVVTPPAGYMLAPDGITPSHLEVHPDSGSFTLAVNLARDDGSGDLAVYVNADSLDAVAGATIDAFEAGGSTPIATGVTGDNGGFAFALAPGSYDVELVGIPAGYELPDGAPSRLEGLIVTTGHTNFARWLLVDDS